MRIVGKEKLFAFKLKHGDVISQVDSWIAEVGEARWSMPLDIKRRYASASFIGNKNVVFDLKGGNYRLWTLVDYPHQIVLIKDAGTHKEYDKWKII